jgi:hypothetical protein
LRKTILKHAFVILTVAFVLGLVAGAAGGNHSPLARAWLASHMTGILVCLLMSVVGLMWSDLQLGPRARRVLYWATVPANYVNLLVLGILIPALGGAPAIAVPDAPPAPGGVKALLAVGIIFASVVSFLMAGLVLYGLRRRPGDDPA